MRATIRFDRSSRICNRKRDGFAGIETRRSFGDFALEAEEFTDVVQEKRRGLGRRLLRLKKLASNVAPIVRKDEIGALRQRLVHDVTVRHDDALEVLQQVRASLV